MCRSDVYEEAQTTLCSAPVNVKIAAQRGEQELGRVSVRVLPVHTFFTTGANADFQIDYNCFVWEYASVLATTGGEFSSVEFSTDVSVYCGTWPFGTYGYACTTGTSVVFGTSTFTGSENKAASIIGHELLHTTGANECAAYTWEFNHDTGTGIFQCDTSYLANVVQMMNCKCSGINCPEEQQ